MVDTTSECLQSLADVARQLGKHIATIYRWTTTGVRGVVLETIQVGGARYTSREALQRFCERLTTGAPVAAPVQPTTRSERAARELESYGV